MSEKTRYETMRGPEEQPEEEEPSNDNGDKK